jgi:hydrazine synthase alpha subunit-like protein/concanavalin A-like lectin/glucanase superfamily protein
VGRCKPVLRWLLCVSVSSLCLCRGVFAGEAVPTSEADCVREGPVARWDLATGHPNEPFVDRTGKHSDKLQSIGGTPSEGVLCLGIHETDPAYLVAPVSSDLQLGPSYTIEAWILPTDVNGWKRLVLHWGSGTDWAYHLAIHYGRASLAHGQTNGTHLLCEGGQIAAGRTAHLVGVARSGEQDPTASTLEVYVNGQLVSSLPFDGTTRELDNIDLGLGDSAAIPSADSRFRGYLGRVSLWNRALSSVEIRDLANDPIPSRKLDGLEKGLREDQRRQLERQLADRAAVLDRLEQAGVERIVFAERHPGRDYQGHYYANFGYSCVDPEYWLHGADGGRLLALDVKRRRVDALLDDPDGAVRDPQVHYDARKILFSYRKGGTHNYHLYEIDTDGKNLHQLTDGPWDDVEPTYLPGGDIAFCSTRCQRYIGCWLAPSAILFRCDATGKNHRMLSSGAFTENTPTVLPDGRLLYTRWEYVNRDAVSFHHLWTMNPDGSKPTVYFGNQQLGSVFIDAEPTMDGRGTVFIDSPGHGRNEHAGYVTTVAGNVGPNARSAMRHVTQQANYRDPTAIAPELYLAARGNQLLAITEDGDEDVLFEGSAMLHEPCVVRGRPREMVLPEQTDPALSSATVVLADAYVGRNMEGVGPGTIRRLLVLEDLPKPVNFHGGGSQPIGHGVTSTLKRILGTVPVEPDGSAHFNVPAMRSLYFALLDENDHSIKQMRSFVTLQPGETLSCVGCHEPRTETPTQTSLQALTRPPSSIEAIPGINPIPDFPRDVQPILDRHCVECHRPNRPDGAVNLAGDRGPVYSLAYYELLLHWQIKDTQSEPKHGTGRQPGNDPPYTTYSSASPLMDKIDGSHYDVRLSPTDSAQIRLWIDAGAQFPGTYAAYGTGQIGGCWRSNEPIREMADDWPETGPAAEAIERRCGACHPASQLPRHVTARIPLDSWGDMLAWTRPLSRYSRHRIFNVSEPANSLALLVSLSEKAGGLASVRDTAPQPAPPENRTRPPQPVPHPIVFQNTDDVDYRLILSHLAAAQQRLNEIKRFDMPGFRPNEHYLREMQRYGILPASLDHKEVDPYETERRYWESMWPDSASAPAHGM